MCLSVNDHENTESAIRGGEGATNVFWQVAKFANTVFADNKDLTIF